MPLYVLAVVLGAFLQIATIYFLRGDFVKNFFYTIPLILVYQFLFLLGYANAPKFIIIWFVTTALTNGLAFLVGYYIFHEQLSVWNLFGALLVVAGVILINLK